MSEAADLAERRGLYVHIPFCVKRCYYCDFNTYTLDRSAVRQFLDALGREIRLYAQQLEAELPTFDTLFIGGGTPTCLSQEQLRSVVGMIRDHFSLAPDAEVTCEANPGSSNEDKYATLREAGVNRLSIGVQSLDDDLLQKIGRMHNANEALESIEAARRSGFTNISVDLMFALPGQTLDQWQRTVQRVVDYAPEHLSCYSLIIEEGTPFGEAYRHGRLQLPPEEEELAMYEWLIFELRAGGYHHYEVSSFCLPGYESRHNTIYWRIDPYLGLGPGAHGYWDDFRYSNVLLPDDYAKELSSQRLPIAQRQTVSTDELMDDTMIFGLRLLEGVDRARFRRRFGVDVQDVYPRELDRLQRLGLIHLDAERVRLTSDGLMLGNQVFAEFLRLDASKPSLAK